MKPGVARTYADEAAWLAARREGIGSSEVPILAGASTYRRPYDLWAEKVGLVEPDPIPTRYQAWGRRLQSVILGAYGEETGYAVEEVPPLTVYVDPDGPHRRASPDAIVRAPQGLGLVDAKNVSEWKKDEWVEDPPLAFVVQVQWQLLILGTATWGGVAALIGGNTPVHAHFEPHARLQMALLDQVDRFWERVLRETPPPVDGAESTAAVLRRAWTPAPQKTISLPPEAAVWDARRCEALATIEAAEALKREASNRLMAALGDAELGMLPDGTAYSFRLIERKGYVVEPRTSRELRRRQAKKGQAAHE